MPLGYKEDPYDLAGEDSKTAPFFFANGTSLETLKFIENSTCFVSFHDGQEQIEFQVLETDTVGCMTPNNGPTTNSMSSESSSADADRRIRSATSCSASLLLLLSLYF